MEPALTESTMPYADPAGVSLRSWMRRAARSSSKGSAASVQREFIKCPVKHDHVLRTWPSALVNPQQRVGVSLLLPVSGWKSSCCKRHNLSTLACGQFNTLLARSYLIVSQQYVVGLWLKMVFLNAAIARQPAETVFPNISKENLCVGGYLYLYNLSH